MVLYYISSSSISTTSHGDHNDITTTISADQTNCTPELLDMKSYNMDNKRTLEDFKLLLSGRFNNDLELMARSLGLPSDQIRSILLENGISEEVDKRLNECGCKNGDYFQFGNRVEINNSGDGYQQSFADILESDNEVIKKLKADNAHLKKIAKEKDELIASLRDTIEILKNK